MSEIEGMAVVGRVSAVPKDDFVLGKAYKRLDMVRYENNLYTAKKNNSGILPTDTEYWMLAIESVSGDANGITYDNTESGLDAENVQEAIDKLADRAVIAQAPSEENPEGKLGNVKPDGKTITITEDGTIKGSASGFTGTRAEFEEALARGEIEEGMIVNITDDYNSGIIDDALSETSKNPVQNKVITEELAKISTAVNDANDSLEGVQRDIDNILNGTSKVGDSAKLDGVTKDNFMGEAGFIYKAYDLIDLDTITYESHISAFNPEHAPKMVGTTGTWWMVDTSVAKAGYVRQFATSFEIFFAGVQHEKEIYYRTKWIDSDWTDWTQLLTSGMVCNPNLLDNWYFLNPVNQKGLLSSNQPNIYILDRWKTVSNSLGQNPDGMDNIFDNDGFKAGSISQPIPHLFDVLYGKIVTVSLLDNKGNLGACTFTVDGSTMEWYKAKINYSSDNQAVAILYKWGGYMNGQLNFNVNAIGDMGDSRIIAVKLELGNFQTLAHKEGDKWVLNEIPKYSEQLLECQRYFKNMVRARMSCSGAGWWNVITNFSPEMRIAPTIKTSDIVINHYGVTAYYCDIIEKVIGKDAIACIKIGNIRSFRGDPVELDPSIIYEIELDDIDANYY